MSIATNIKIRTTALCCHYGSIADILDAVEKVSMVGKGFLQSVCNEVTSYFYYFADDINVLFCTFIWNSLCYFALLFMTFTSEIKNNIENNLLQLDRSIIIFLYGNLGFPLLCFEIECAQQYAFKVNVWYKKDVLAKYT